MGFRIDKASAQDRILNQFDRVIKNDKQREKDDLKKQLEDMEKASTTKRRAYDEDKPVFLPSYAIKYKMEAKDAKKNKK